MFVDITSAADRGWWECSGSLDVVQFLPWQHSSIYTHSTQSQPQAVTEYFTECCLHTDWFYWKLLQPLKGWIAKYNMYTKRENTNNRKVQYKKTCILWLCLYRNKRYNMHAWKFQENFHGNFHWKSHKISIVEIWQLQSQSKLLQYFAMTRTAKYERLTILLTVSLCHRSVLCHF